MFPVFTTESSEAELVLLRRLSDTATAQKRIYALVCVHQSRVGLHQYCSSSCCYCCCLTVAATVAVEGRWRFSWPALPCCRGGAGMSRRRACGADAVTLNAFNEQAVHSAQLRQHMLLIPACSDMAC